MALLLDNVQIVENGIRASPRADRVGGIRGRVAQALHLSRLTPDAANMLIAKLGFYPTLLMGKLGRGMVGPLITRQYWRRNNRLTQRLRMCFFWQYTAVYSLPPRTTPFLLRPPLGAPGHIAAKFGLPDTKTITHHLPECVRTTATKAEGESPVYLYELCAAILLARIALSWGDASNRAVVLCVDNQAAVAALTMGSSAAEFDSVLVNAFWISGARPNAQWWIEYVPTAANLAD